MTTSTSSRERVLLPWYRPFLLGGVETFMLHMVRAARQRGDLVWIAATHDAQGPLRRDFEQAGATIMDWTSFADAFAGRAPPGAACVRIAQDVAAIRPTLVLLNDCNDLSIGAAPILGRMREFATVIDTFHIDSPDTRYLEFRRHFAPTLDGAVGTNRHILERFAKHDASFARIPSAYIPNGVPPCSAAHALPGGVLRLLYLGRLAQDQKRVLLLPELFAQLRERGVEFEATICGEGPARAELESALQGHGLSKRVRVTGYRAPAEVQDLLLHHDVLVNVSSFEGFSMSVLEALAAGCVPTCTDVASLDHEHLVDGSNCLLAPVDRPEVLVDHWGQLTPGRLQQLSSQARASSLALGSQACYDRYVMFARQLRELRPTREWPADAHEIASMRWDIARDNPWTARRRAAWRNAFGAIKRKLLGA